MTVSHALWSKRGNDFSKVPIQEFLAKAATGIVGPAPGKQVTDKLFNLMIFLSLIYLFICWSHYFFLIVCFWLGTGVATTMRQLCVWLSFPDQMRFHECWSAKTLIRVVLTDGFYFYRNVLPLFNARSSYLRAGDLANTSKCLGSKRKISNTTDPRRLGLYLQKCSN